MTLQTAAVVCMVVMAVCIVGVLVQGLQTLQSIKARTSWTKAADAELDELLRSGR